MKKLLSSILLLLVFSTAIAQEPMSREDMLREAWKAQPDKHAEITQLYWMEVQHQIDQTQQYLPHRISSTTITHKVDLTNKTITYHYTVTTNQEMQDNDVMRKVFRQRLCMSERTVFMLQQMKGSMVFAYYRLGNTQPFDVYAFTGVDCPQPTGI